MNGKILLVSLSIMVGIIGIMSWKIKTNGTASAAKGEIISLTTNPNPLRLGQVTFMIDVKDENGKPVDNATVSFDLNMTAMNMGTQRGDAISQGSGRYSAVGNMSMRGPWRVRTTVKIPDGNMKNKDFIVNVP